MPHDSPAPPSSPSSSESLRERAGAAHDSLLAVQDAALTSPDPVASAGLLVDAVRAAAEQRARAERALGLLLRAYPDPGGRPRTSAPEPVARQLRQTIGVRRGHLLWLTRLADVPQDVFEELLREMWESFPVSSMAARTLVKAAEERGGKATSSDSGESRGG